MLPLFLTPDGGGRRRRFESMRSGDYRVRAVFSNGAGCSVYGPLLSRRSGQTACRFFVYDGSRGSC
jgi:hypothetical protein